MQFVDVGQNAQLVHVDDLDDACRRDAFALPGENLHDHAVQRRPHQSVFAGAASAFNTRLGVGKIDIVLLQIVGQCRLHQVETDLLTLETLIGQRRFKLALVGRPARPLADKGVELGLLERRLELGILEIDLGDARTLQDRLVRLLQLAEIGLRHPQRHVRAGVIRQNGDDLVLLDFLAVLDLQLEKNAAAGGIARHDRGACRGIGVAARDQRRLCRFASVLSATRLVSRQHPEADASDRDQERHTGRAPLDFRPVSHCALYQKPRQFAAFRTTS